MLLIIIYLNGLEGVNKKVSFTVFLLGIDRANRLSRYKVVSNSSQVCVFRY
ncbi:hypothetical protein PROSTU_00123 [Providencia stuartii ATCC 25827]|uniref:Uncharacterized protein n=1 Tax=Providencia stuartii ATCC 25827 TaxID=471874 RepID=A0AA86YD57_PROST|nr:hypothetical protein PROSTU_04488 [Providencia stuartii ATCC 25827]EDU61854.1 hypothetical protein PROSTU_00123 [Providencia stuartii ATCC 25827]